MDIAFSSFRCEAYGILAATRLILRLRQFYHLPSNNNTITWWCDCKSLIQRLTYQDHPIDPNRILLAEHDVEFAIRATLPLLTNDFIPRHLHSHQADHIPLASLPIHLRLNRLADELAKTHNKSLPTTNPKIPLITLSACQIHTRGATISNSISRHLTNAFNHSTSIKHISNRLRIDHTTQNQIAWKEFARALSSLTTGHQRIIRRWIYGFLPTQKRLHRYKACTSPTCPMCESQVETDHHFLLCGGVTSWSDNLFSPLERTCRKHDATHWVENTITTNLIKHIENRAPIAHNQWIQAAFESQTQIGWNNTMYGIFSTAWITHQNDSRPHHPNGSTLLTAIIKTIFSAIIARWEVRNQQLHRQQSSTTEVRNRLTTQIRALYACQPKVLPSDRFIFSIPLAQFLLKPVHVLQLFVDQNQPIVVDSIKRYHMLILRQHIY